LAADIIAVLQTVNSACEHKQIKTAKSLQWDWVHTSQWVHRMFCGVQSTRHSLFIIWIFLWRVDCVFWSPCDEL